MKKISKFCVWTLLLTTISGCGNSAGQEGQDAPVAAVMTSIVMAYQEERNGHKESYLYEEGDLSLELYADQDGNTCFRINDQILPFDDSNGYYVSPITDGPVVCFYDINGDGQEDLFVYDEVVFPPGMAQNTYLSCEDGNYRALGGLCWNENSIEEYGYKVSLQDDFQVLVELQNYQIEESFPISREFQEIAVDMGFYTENETPTEYGKAWEESEIYGYASLPCVQHIDFEVDYYGHVLIRLEAPIMAGYSSYELGGGFTFYWTIEEGEYHLVSIAFRETARESFYRE